MAHKFSWFVTNNGRKFTFGLVCAASIGICSAYTIPHTILINKYQEVVQLYKSGIPVKLSEKVLQRYNKAMDILELPEEERKLVKPFTVFGFDVFNAGTLYSRFGGLVGIPVNFTYIDEEYIDRNNIMVNNEPVNWSTETAQQLLHSLVLSEDAQLFAIAREILYLRSFKLVLDTLYASSVIVLMYGLGYRLNQKYNLYPKPLMLRLIMYSIIAMFGFGLYSFFTDYTQIQYDISVDKKLCEKDSIFVNGGKEFYEKTVSRNIALRKLMGPLGEKYYSALGNENFFIRQKRLPLLIRKDFFENKMKGTI